MERDNNYSPNPDSTFSDESFEASKSYTLYSSTLEWISNPL